MNGLMVQRDIVYGCVCSNEVSFMYPGYGDIEWLDRLW